jgi:hypothetical protein
VTAVVTTLPTEPLTVRVARPYAHAAPIYGSAGWSGMVPVWTDEGGAPHPLKGMTGRDGTDTDAAIVWTLIPVFGDHDIALRLPEGVVGIDVDAYGEKNGAGTLAQWEVDYGALPETAVSTSRSDGVSGIRLFRVPEGTGKLAGDLGAHSDVEVIQRHHRFVSCWPTFKPKTGAVYRWLHPDGRPVDTVPRVDELPMLPQAWVVRLEKTAKARPVPTDLPAGLYDGSATGGIGAAWVARRPQELMCPPVEQELEDALLALEDGTRNRHDVALGPVWRLVSLAREGHLGVGPALDTLQGAFLDAKPGAEAEWARSLDGAVGKAPGDPEGGCLCGLMSGTGLSAVAEDFWQTRPVLAHVRDFARARLISPWALLGAVLVRTVAEVPPWVVLPPTVGVEASLNLFVALTGPSGSGKGAAIGAAAAAVKFGEVVTATPGSGEGLAAQYATRDSKGKITRLAESVLFIAPEVDTLTALSQRMGSTLLSQLRSAWSGEELGYAYRDPSKRLPIPAHSYRLGLILGVQPGRAEPLLADADGGTPQRFLWLPTQDPGAVLDAPAPPPRLELPAIAWKRPGATSLVHLPIPPEAGCTIRQAGLAKMRGQADALDGHSLLSRLKLAAALGILEGRPEVSPEDWELAGQIMAVSDQTRADVVKLLSAQRVQANERRGHFRGQADAAAEDAKADVIEKRVNRSVLRLLEKHGPLPLGQLKKKLNSRDREHAEAAVDRLAELGLVTVTETTHGVRVELAGGSK